MCVRANTLTVKIQAFDLNQNAKLLLLYVTLQICKKFFFYITQGLPTDVYKTISLS